MLGRGAEPSRWAFPPLDSLTSDDDLVAIGADLQPGTLLSAYQAGYFPMPLQRRRIGWFSPVERGVLLANELQVSRSLRRSTRRYTVTQNTAFSQVIAACADPSRDHGWIDRRIIAAYTELHRLGHAHSIEAWEGDQLVGGLYGVSIGGFFAGESMFYLATDASKVALVHLVNQLGSDEHVLLDVQWSTPHLESLGARSIPRNEYGRRLLAATQLPQCPAFPVVPVQN